MEIEFWKICLISHISRKKKKLGNQINYFLLPCMISFIWYPQHNFCQIWKIGEFVDSCSVLKKRTPLLPHMGSNSVRNASHTIPTRLHVEIALILQPSKTKKSKFWLTTSTLSLRESRRSESDFWLTEWEAPHNCQGSIGIPSIFGIFFIVA